MRKYGEIAETFGFGKMELKVCRSGAGFYIGTWDDVEGPTSRESLDNDTWIQREDPWLIIYMYWFKLISTYMWLII